MKFRLFLLLLIGLLGACTTVTVHVDKKASANLAKVKVIFIEHRLNDDHTIDLFIANELKKIGRDSTAGPMTMMPENADTIISYDDQWTFDFSTHMTGLQIRLRDAHSDAVIASGDYFQSSVARKSPETIVHEVMTAIFKKQ